ncbi:MAG: site-2 protease family protein [Anaerolineales bacterium]
MEYELADRAASDIDEQSLRDVVSRHMSVDDVTRGGPQQDFAIRFRGRLITPSEEAFDALQPLFREHGLTMFFRKEDQKHLVIGVPGLIQPEPSNPWVNVALFLFTLLSVILAGALYANINFYPQQPTELGIDGVGEFFDLFLGGIPFALALLAILLAHEFGHYLAGRFHKTAVTLPYFLPFPGTILGTLGAFIRMKEPPKNRRVLMDIGLAGPLAGFIVAVPILFIGLSLSEITQLPRGADGGILLEGNSILYLLAKYITKGELLPAPRGFNGLAPAVYWLRYFFLGKPIPFGGMDVLVHPLAWAGWAGLLVTALNLIPAGQLDGGHLIYVLLGDKAKQLWLVIVAILVALGFVWTGWWIWAALIFFLGRYHAQTLDSITPLDGKRKALAVLGLVIFVLTFTPVPLVTLAG